MTAWNRTPGKAHDVVAAGGKIASTVEDAVKASPLVVVCLLDEASVHEQLDPVTDALSGRIVVNVTTTTPDEARALATWAHQYRIGYVDGGLMASPEMIGTAASLVLYSGDEHDFEQYRHLLENWGTATFVGSDPGMAAMYDTAILGTMYAMFGGFKQGGRMVRTVGGSAGTLAEMAIPFLQAVAAVLTEQAREIDTPEEYEPVQSAEFTAGAIDLINRSAVEAGQTPDLLSAARRLLAENA
ncbi:NAD binding domain of 6-phosphogluconate dehydrogenase [Prauserella marina]|uniref:NAD binding domain of 6-phosphogluconate dehydrogenase n=1 Tax=Prauserella marina TaxID=530584 RepID=A0A1G6ZBY8_9PSEU|nr:6-phosphogluconate dehydrogenase-like protein [Prauserella marina]SDE00138.1 NAD binding domain of 6-phosphogluconate dehydrogenase [Prauserella marina]